MAKQGKRKIYSSTVPVVSTIENFTIPANSNKWIGGNDIKGVRIILPYSDNLIIDGCYVDGVSVSDTITAIKRTLCTLYYDDNSLQDITKNTLKLKLELYCKKAISLRFTNNTSSDLNAKFITYK